MSDQATCSLCGRIRGGDEEPAQTLAWVSTREKNVVRWMCPACARRHARDIEGKLPDEYW
ncbi:hypothetical protein [Amycolatopsis sp. NPDC057786]|uniref:hypothetical protein n=1 Tax=Amycolatopsis sp. NPDC057786 TaxID=3346250 RepID=UPI003671BD10